MKFPSHLKCDGKLLVKWAPGRRLSMLSVKIHNITPVNGLHLKHRRTEFLWEYIEIYSNLLSLLSIEMLQAVEILPCGWEGPVYHAESMHRLRTCWWPCDVRSQGINSHNTCFELVIPFYSGFSTRRGLMVYSDSYVIVLASQLTRKVTVGSIAWSG